MIDRLAPHALAFAIDVARLVVWLVLLVAVFVPLERLFALHPAKVWRRQVGVDLAWYFINSLVPAAIIAIPLAILARALRGADPGGLYSAVAAWPLWVKIPVVLVVSDIGAYWGHRASHAFPLLWRFHVIHHSAEQLDWLVNTRAHPFDMVFTRLAGLAPVYLLGLAQTTGHRLDPTVALVTVLGTIWTFFIHANIRLRLGPLEWLVSTPAFHHWHHTNDEHRDRNFAAMFPLIDRLFGTAWLPKYWPPVYGADAQVSPTLAGQLLNPVMPQIERPGSAQSSPEIAAGANVEGQGSHSESQAPDIHGKPVQGRADAMRT
ncbi:MAG TPA: sterol desaturase family protein [Verrucomicrobiota bacterium]|nr:sterol desaturase family protein [Verrucomicrobiales bacterium]HRI14071.1 sterol desaturase family protein [Verrucomicrobiota bacterium]